MSINFQQKKLGSHAGAAVICGDSKASTYPKGNYCWSCTHRWDLVRYAQLSCPFNCKEQAFRGATGALNVPKKKEKNKKVLRLGSRFLAGLWSLSALGGQLSRAAEQLTSCGPPTVSSDRGKPAWTPERPASCGPRGAKPYPKADGPASR
jgi:hypothetical protein